MKDLYRARKAPSGRELSSNCETEGERVSERFLKPIGHAGSLTRLRREPSARVASIACFPLWLKICHRHIFDASRPPGGCLRITDSVRSAINQNLADDRAEMQKICIDLVGAHYVRPRANAVRPYYFVTTKT